MLMPKYIIKSKVILLLRFKPHTPDFFFLIKKKKLTKKQEVKPPISHQFSFFPFFFF